MPFQGRLPVRRLYRFFCCSFLHAQDLVIVFLAGCFSFLLGKLEFLTDLEAGRVDRCRCTIVLHSFLPLFQVLVNLTTFDQSLSVVWLHLEAEVEGRQSILILAQFNLADSLVQAYS